MWTTAMSENAVERRAVRRHKVLLPAKRWCCGQQRNGEQAKKSSHGKGQFDGVTR